MVQHRVGLLRVWTRCSCTADAADASRLLSRQATASSLAELALTFGGHLSQERQQHIPHRQGAFTS